MATIDLPYRGLWPALEEILDADFTGQIVLHCNQGNVASYDVIHRGIIPRNGVVDLEESAGRKRNRG